MQVKALVNAKTITERIFTKDESAQNHCQIGNIGLALNTMLDWIEKYETNRQDIQFYSVTSTTFK